MRRCGSACLAVCVTLLSWAPAAGQTAAPAGGAASRSEYDEVQRKLARTRRLAADAEARERALRRTISRTAAQRHALEDDIAELTAQLEAVGAELDEAEAELAVVNARLGEKSGELIVEIGRLQDARSVLQRRAAQVYMTGPASLFDFVLGARTFSDLITRIRLLEGIFSADDTRIENFVQARDKVNAEVRDIEALKELVAEQVRLVAARRARVAGLKSSIDVKRRALDAQLRRQYSTLEDVQESKAEYLRQMRILEQESARIGSLLKGRGGGRASARPGEMAWPTRGTVTSSYGWRVHPIYHDRRFHGGIDIGAPSGQAVVAAASGSVVSAGPRSGYGNTVVLDHGGGLATVYAHMSSIGVSAGQSVAQGRTIGRVGCTGTCTGPHLHFEVRVNGETRDPMNWLP